VNAEGLCELMRNVLKFWPDHALKALCDNVRPLTLLAVQPDRF
jgi:hypothetical protein